jgi:hypothetical protein
MPNPPKFASKCRAHQGGACGIPDQVGHRCMHWDGPGSEHPKEHRCPCGHTWK